MDKPYLIIFGNNPIASLDITHIAIDEVTRMIRGHMAAGRELKLIGYSLTDPHLRFS